MKQDLRLDRDEADRLWPNYWKAFSRQDGRAGTGDFAEFQTATTHNVMNAVPLMSGGMASAMVAPLCDSSRGRGFVCACRFSQTSAGKKQMNQSKQTAAIADRVRRVRLELFGSNGVMDLAKALGVPAATWASYEAGVTIPAGIVLAFIVATGASPMWLLTGEGEQYVARLARSEVEFASLN
jgi:hypothetical protein